MGLSFLNKKIWHPGSFCNIEKVWIAEQKHKEFERKAIENAKKIKEERAIEELKKIQVENGLIPKSHLNRLDFMYQGPGCTSNLISAEEFLLGKSVNEESNAEKKHFTPVFQENYSNPQNEIFTKIHEDPLYLIKKEEMRQRKEIEENPYKVKLLLKDLESKTKIKDKIEKKEDEKKDKNKNNKIKLKEHKEDRHKHKSRSRSRNRSRSRSLSSRSKSKEKDSRLHHHHHHHHRKEDKYYRK